MTETDSIITELLQDIETKDALIETLTTEAEEEFLSHDFTVLRRGKRVIITGVALAEGTWKGKWYDRNHIKLSAGGLAGVVMDVEHGHHPSWGDTVVGEVLTDEWNEKLQALLYEAEITNDQMAQEILSGHWKGVSVQIARNHYRTDKGELGVKDIQYVRLTITKFPACKLCQVLSVTEEQLANMPELLNNGDQVVQPGETSMTEETEETLSEETPTTEKPVQEADTSDSLKALADVINSDTDDALKVESITKILKDEGAITNADLQITQLKKQLGDIRALIDPSDNNGEEAPESPTTQTSEESESSEEESTETPEESPEQIETTESEEEQPQDEDTELEDDKTKQSAESESTETEPTETTESQETDEQPSEEGEEEEESPSLEQIISEEGRTLDDDADTATKLLIESIQRGEW
jgi:hypothetical protein